VVADHTRGIATSIAARDERGRLRKRTHHAVDRTAPPSTSHHPRSIIDTHPMKLAHLADPHIGHRQYGLEQREDDMVSTFRHTLGAIEEDGVDAILLPGDLFHSRDLRPENLDTAEQALSDLVPDDVPVIVSRGNHDENLSPRDVTWLNYLHHREHIVLLEADLESDPETARFSQHDFSSPGDQAGFVDLPATDADGPVRVFGLQWRGARTDVALEQIARGIRATNDQYGEPAYTVLLGHFGMEDEVPTLGGTITHAELRDVREVVDYLALGHIHKRYEAAGWVYNPGSPEAHNTREGRDDWDHGYYTVDLAPDEESDGPGTLADDVRHHATKRRPYYRVEFDVTPHESPGDLRTEFRERIRSERDAIEAHCAKDIYTSGDQRRAPLLDLRFTGTLQFSRPDLQAGELAEWAEDACDALYVQTTTGIRTADVQALLSELEEDDVFVDGRLNTGALERRVFETIAAESEYGEHADAVADVLERAHTMAQGDEDPEDITGVISEQRRELFPDMIGDVSIDIPEDPFADAETGPDTEGSHTEETDTEETDTEAVVGETGAAGGVDLDEFASANGGEPE
jgi:DNA repair exonuclease SbcCD nuclease subunit